MGSKSDLKTVIFIEKFHESFNPVSKYLFKVNNKNTKTMCEICLKYAQSNDKGTKTTLLNSCCCLYCISHDDLLFSILSLNKLMPNENWNGFIYCFVCILVLFPDDKNMAIGCWDSRTSEKLQSLPSGKCYMFWYDVIRFVCTR